MMQPSDTGKIKTPEREKSNDLSFAYKLDTAVRDKGISAGNADKKPDDSKIEDDSEEEKSRQYDSQMVVPVAVIPINGEEQPAVASEAAAAKGDINAVTAALPQAGEMDADDGNKTMQNGIPAGVQQAGELLDAGNEAVDSGVSKDGLAIAGKTGQVPVEGNAEQAADVGAAKMETVDASGNDGGEIISLDKDNVKTAGTVIAEKNR
jgi:hypothetical protein